MIHTLFSDDDIALWEGFLNDPPRLLDEAELPALPRVESFNADLMLAGIVFNMRARSGEEFAFALNPVAARHLASCILHLGVLAGWLNDRGDVAKPLKPVLS